MRRGPGVIAKRSRHRRLDRHTLGSLALVLTVGLPALVLGYQAKFALLAGPARGGVLAAAAGLIVLLAIPLHFLTLRWHVAPLADRLATDRKRLREIAARGARAQEVERMRIARDLRDDLAQLLASTLLRLRIVRSLPDGLDRDDLMDEVGAAIGSSIERVRSVAQAVHPPALAELGVTAALRSYARTVIAGTAVQAEVEEHGVSRALAPETALALFRVAQEALANAVRHANAAHAYVYVAWDDGEVSVVVSDDGVGFDPELTESRSPCLGLFSMHERALAVGGSARVESVLGRGTTVSVRVPASEESTSRLAPWPTILPTRV